MLDSQKLSASYELALRRQVLPFWLAHSQDTLCGGYFDLLSANGSVIDGDKYVAEQAQQVWAFAWLYNTLERQSRWLDHALHGAQFLHRFARNEAGGTYSQLDRRGCPVAPAEDLRPTAGMVLAYAELYAATNDEAWAESARLMFDWMRLRREELRTEPVQPAGSFRRLRHLGEVAMLFKAALRIQPLLDEATGLETVQSILDELLREFVDRRTDTLRETVLTDGAFLNTPIGRRLNVGLTCQTANYLLDYAAQPSKHRTGNRTLAARVVGWCLRLCAQAWDEAAGGLNAHVDWKGQPSIFPDESHKWAWVQFEALSALVKGYAQTGSADCLTWFRRIHEYTFAQFPDPRHTGWHLALDRQRQPLLRAKAIPSVGCYTLIRCLAETAQTLRASSFAAETPPPDRGPRNRPAR